MRSAWPRRIWSWSFPNSRNSFTDWAKLCTSAVNSCRLSVRSPLLRRQPMHVRRQQLQALSQSSVSFSQPIQAFVSGHIDILPLSFSF